MNNFKIGRINDIIIKDLIIIEDHRGWLLELFRKDMIDNKIIPEMSYISLTYPGMIRGPHEHLRQTDYFCFLGPSILELFLWDNRKESSTYRHKISLKISENNPKNVIVPPRIVHAYKNIGDSPSLVINFPNRLYAGVKKKENIDEIRHEDDPFSSFKVD